MKPVKAKKLNDLLRKNLLNQMTGDGRTQQERADRAGITQATLSRIMSGKQRISAVNLVRLANLYNVPLDDLVGRKVQEP